MFCDSRVAVRYSEWRVIPWRGGLIPGSTLGKNGEAPSLTPQNADDQKLDSSRDSMSENRLETLPPTLMLVGRARYSHRIGGVDCPMCPPKEDFTMMFYTFQEPEGELENRVTIVLGNDAMPPKMLAASLPAL